MAKKGRARLSAGGLRFLQAACPHATRVFVPGLGIAARLPNWTPSTRDGWAMAGKGPARDQSSLFSPQLPRKKCSTDPDAPPSL